MSQRTDKELVAAILDGATEQYSELVKRYQGRIVNYLYRLLRNVDDAHDLSQEVFLRVYRALDRYNPQYKFSTWLYRVSQNAAIDVEAARKEAEDARNEMSGATVTEQTLIRRRLARAEARLAVGSG